MDITTPDQSIPAPAAAALASFEAALTQATPVVTAVRADDLTLPTPCSEFRVADLLSHLLAVLNRVEVVIGGGSFTTTPITLPLDDITAQWPAGVQRTLGALGAAGDLTGTVAVPWGEVPAFAAVSGWADEFVVHTWDLAVALGRDVAGLDPALAEAALTHYGHSIPPEARNEYVPFDAPVQVPADADAYTRLVAFTGRDPRWSAQRQ